MPEGEAVRLPSRVSETFSRAATAAGRAAGHAVSFTMAFLVIVLWASTGPLFGFSDTWQLVINTGTTIVTFLMVFLIQNSQNRDTKAIHLKLDALILAARGADNRLVDAEEQTEAELRVLQEYFRRVAQRVQNGGEDPFARVSNSEELLERIRAQAIAGSGSNGRRERR